MSLDWAPSLYISDICGGGTERKCDNTTIRVISRRKSRDYAKERSKENQYESVYKGNVKLSTVCRACLKKEKDMKFLLDGTQETDTLLAKFVSVLNLEVEFISKYPSYLCKICEIKTNNSFEFKEQCKKSNELIYQYSVNLENQGDEEIDIDEDGNININKRSTVTIMDDHNYSEVSRITSDICVYSNSNKLKEVDVAIEYLSHKYKQDFICIFCGLHVATSKNLQVHITDIHQNSADDKEHLKAYNSDFLCQFCNCQFFTVESTIGHLLSHKGASAESKLLDSDGQPVENNYKYGHKAGGIKDEDITLKIDETRSIEGEKEMEMKIFANEFEMLGLEEVAKVKIVNQRRCLKQYSSEVVDKVVKMVREKLNRHVTCMFCQFEASSNRTLSMHVTRLHGEFKGRWCSICNQLIDDLVLHNKEAHCEDLKCPLCNRILSNMGHFVEHMDSHSETGFHQCTICNKTFLSRRYLRRHREAHKISPEKRRLQPNSSEVQICTSRERSGEPQNYCSRCDRKVRSLQHHNNKYHSAAIPVAEEGKKLCMYCGKQFKTMSKLTIHIRTHTGEAPYKCQYCDKRLKTRNILMVHERTHTGQKPYTCTVCGKNFAQSSVLKTHIRIHTGKPEQCTICEKRFCRPAELRLHMRKHTGETPYTCEFCHKGFKQTSHLAEHLKRHSNDRPFKCNFCEKAFKSPSTLKCHLQIHSGDKPFKCLQCSYACRQPYSLTQHMLQHEDDKPQANHPHTCEICQRSFATVAHLTSHCNRFHSHLDVKSVEPSNGADIVTDIHFVPENIEFIDQTQAIIIDDSNRIQMIETVERVEDDLNQSKFDPMFEFTSAIQ